MSRFLPSFVLVITGSCILRYRAALTQNIKDYAEAHPGLGLPLRIWTNKAFVLIVGASMFVTAAILAAV